MTEPGAQAKKEEEGVKQTAAMYDVGGRKYRTFQPVRQGSADFADASSDALVLLVLGVKAGKQYHTLTDWVRRGLPATSVDRLVKVFGISQKDLSGIIDIPVPTLQRRKKAKQRLTTAESDRVVRIAKIRQQTIDMMHGDSQAARRWLISPKQVLGGESPLERASTEAGAAEVEQLIGRVRHGVFS